MKLQARLEVHASSWREVRSQHTCLYKQEAVLVYKDTQGCMEFLLARQESNMECNTLVIPRCVPVSGGDLRGN
ncbi:hypothetical protein GN956_G16735 [Arapaima gigas]